MSSSSPLSVSSLPPTMCAVVAHIPDGEFKLKEIPTPQITDSNPYDLLVNVKAASLNPMDGKIRRGKVGGFSGDRTLGYDASGIVVAVGSEAQKFFKVGDHVMYAGVYTRQGSNAEYQLIDSRLVGRKPSNLSWEQTAAIPLVGITAFEAFTEKLFPYLAAENPPHPIHGNHHYLDNENQKKHKGKSILIIGGAGGVGSAAIQLAKLFELKVIATASRKETKEWCERMGADIIIDHSKDYATEFKEHGIESVDFVLNTVSETLLPKFISLVKPRGHIVGINRDMNEDAAKAFGSIGFVRRLTLSCEMMFSRGLLNYELEEQGKILNVLSSIIEQGKFKPIDSVIYNWKDMSKAHDKMDEKTSMGKIVVNID